MKRTKITADRAKFLVMQWLCSLSNSKWGVKERAMIMLYYVIKHATMYGVDERPKVTLLSRSVLLNNLTRRSRDAGD